MPSEQTTFNDPLRLAALYQAGLGGQWRSYREASAKLAADFKVKIGFARIREAVAVSELPSEILGLFGEVGIANRTARELLKAANAQGVASLVERAQLVRPSGKSRTELMALICGLNGTVLKPRNKPLQLAKTYNDGLKDGKWKTSKEAATRLGIGERTINRAIAIASLPEEVLALFPSIGARTGQHLVELTRIRGDAHMITLAIEASREIPRLSPEELPGHFLGLARGKGRVALRKSGSNLILEYHLGPLDEEAESKICLLAMMLNAELPAK